METRDREKGGFRRMMDREWDKMSANTLYVRKKARTITRHMQWRHWRQCIRVSGKGNISCVFHCANTFYVRLKTSLWSKVSDSDTALEWVKSGSGMHRITFALNKTQLQGTHWATTVVVYGCSHTGKPPAVHSVHHCYLILPLQALL